jgi:hypothetical protein
MSGWPSRCFGRTDTTLTRRRAVNRHSIKYKSPSFQTSFYVGVARFELTTSWSQTKRDTGLRYTPSECSKLMFWAAGFDLDDLGALKRHAIPGYVTPEHYWEREYQIKILNSEWSRKFFCQKVIRQGLEPRTVSLEG